ncbi:MAG: 30S ribosomal protein S8 [Deltaproteobacteria bacterium]|nr:30S ribosomal protein S8 [Deltaproteobacteria bacterium]
MKTTDSISDLLVAIKNAQLRKKKDLLVPISNMNSDILRVLKQEGFIANYDQTTVDGKTKLVVTLLYRKDGRPYIHDIRRVSKPSLRKYSGYRQITKQKSDYGVTILSTPKGVISNKEARDSRIGGELLCVVW